MLEFDDIQYIILTRPPAFTGRYEFLSFQDAAGGRQWLKAIQKKICLQNKCITRQKKISGGGIFYLNGLQALGVDKDSLATFPEEFKQVWLLAQTY